DYDDNEPIIDWRFIHQQFNGRTSVQSDKDGNYELKSLRPGRYALSISTRTGQPVIIFGVEVKAGDVTAAPEAMTPKPAFSGTSQNVKGTVLLPDGKPAVGASVGLVSGFSRWGRNCDDKGVFEFSVSEQWMPNRIVVKAGECKPYILELTSPATQLKDLTVRLEKQDYGDLAFKVTDTEGRPLKNVTIRPAATTNRYVYNRTTAERKAVTNKDGQARLTGLASGQRRFVFERDDYYFEGEFKALVVPDKETDVAVTLKSGLKLSGQIDLPPGTSFDKCIVFLSDARSRVTEPDKNGKFEFSGLPPGDYYVSAHAPGLVSQGRVKFTVPSPAGQNVRLKLDKAHAAAIKISEEARDYTAALMPRGSWDPNNVQDMSVYFNTITSSIDQDGRAEFWGASADGEYELVLTPIHQPFSSYRYYNDGSRKATASLVAGPVKTQRINSSDEMVKLPATEINLTPPNGTVTGRLVCEPNIGNASTNYGTLNMKVVGKTAYGQLSFSYPNEFFQQDARTPIFLGTPPEGMRKPSEFGNFAISGLPAGEYQVYIDVTPYNYSGIVRATPAPKTPAKPLMTFTLKAGERLSLGKVKFPVPLKVITEIKSGGGGQNDGDPEDRIQVFQP
ncbi:MAG TPA: carboxypeptidase-like regulatory domain-containing protein, partial [Planctomycetota bacterium]|nr:carboxypeptidase-like regulatory domain-containing protein [Planctomycetota bacterium]